MVSEQPDELDALKDALAEQGWSLKRQIGMAQIGGETCDASGAGFYNMLDGSIRCRCTVCARCGHHTGNAHQGHWWALCKVTRTVREFHFCCGNEFGCELEAESGETP